MTQMNLQKMPGGALIATDDLTAQRINKMPSNHYLVAEVKHPRNSGFHRKYMALLNYLYERWEPTEAAWNGITAEKNFDRFRKDLAIQCGYYELTVNLKGECRAEARSISFASMDQTEFEELYSKTIDLALRLQIAANHSRDDLEQAVETIILGFAA